MCASIRCGVSTSFTEIERGASSVKGSWPLSFVATAVWM
jgi:hypothetical protein